MESKITYELKGKRRKELVQYIAELLGKKATYKGVPTFADRTPEPGTNLYTY